MAESTTGRLLRRPRAVRGATDRWEKQTTPSSILHSTFDWCS